MRRTRVLVGAVLGVVVLGTAACGNVAEKVAEEATERAIESEVGGNADVNLDEDGSFSMKSEDGSFSMSSGSGLAEGFPDAVPLVDGAVQASWSSTDGSSEAWWATIEVDDAEAAYADAKGALEGAGYSITGTYEGTSDGVFSGNLTAEGEWTVNVAAVEGEPSTVSYIVTTPGS